MFFFLLASCCSALAEAREARPKSIYMFAGRYTAGTMGESANPFNADYEDNYVAAAVWGEDVSAPWRGFIMGAEIGLAHRFGASGSLEAWGGMVVRHRGLHILNAITVLPSVTAGLSLTNKSIGVENRREDGRNESARVLFYLGPEIGLSFRTNPRWELVYRLHHRSGGNRVLGRLLEGHNANTLGVRHRF